MNVMAIFVVLVRPLASWIDQHIVVIEKKQPPDQAGLLNLPGGHVRLQEHLMDGALRKLKEETGIDAADLPFDRVGYISNYNKTGQLHVYAVRIDQDPSFLQRDIDTWRAEHMDLAPEKAVVMKIPDALYSSRMIPNTVYMVQEAMKILDNWRVDR